MQVLLFIFKNFKLHASVRCYTSKCPDYVTAEKKCSSFKTKVKTKILFQMAAYTNFVKYC